MGFNRPRSTSSTMRSDDADGRARARSVVVCGAATSWRATTAVMNACVKDILPPTSSSTSTGERLVFNDVRAMTI